jgi:hypothetical protein
MGRGYGIQLRGGRRREGRSSNVRVHVYGSVCVGWEERYVLHVSSFDANICLSFVGISARDARVAVEVVYHHTFLVFGQRSVQEKYDGPISQDEFLLCTKRRGHTAYLSGEREKEMVCEVVFLGATVSDVTIPVHQRTFVYSLSVVFHRHIISFRSRLVDLLRSQRRQVGRSSCGRVNR